VDRAPRERRVRGVARELSAGVGGDTRSTLEAVVGAALAGPFDVLRRPGALATAVGTALAFSLLVLARHGSTFVGWTLVPLAAVLGVIVILDLRSQVVPNAFTLPGIVYTLALAAAFGSTAVIRSLLGVVVAGALLLAFAVVTRGGVGGGDIKLVAMLGGALGWQGALIVFALSQMIGVLWILARSIVRRRFVRDPLPIGAVIAVIGAVFLAAAPLSQQSTGPE
jgi:leader peptidase (prepilin peptidase)/N-methyltransferase